MDTRALLQLEKTNIPLGKSAVSIGRGQANDIDLNDKTVSRLHVTISYRDDSYYIEDCRSTNGTYINGVRIYHRPYKLVSGDQIDLGLTRIIFVAYQPAINDFDPAHSGALDNVLDGTCTQQINSQQILERWQQRYAGRYGAALTKFV